MSFQAKTDYFEISTASGSKFVITDSSENKSAQVSTGQNEKGDVVGWEVYAEQMAPSCSYVLKGDATLNSFKIGEAITVTGISNKKFTISNVSISTAAGVAPKIDVSGSEIPNDTTHTDCTYTVPAATLKECHHAQNIWNSFTINGASTGANGCYLTQADYTISGDLTTATKDGVIVSFDIANGQITINITIQQTGDTEPTLAIPQAYQNEWAITSPLTKTNADASLPSWTATITRYLVHDTSNNNG